MMINKSPVMTVFITTLLVLYTTVQATPIVDIHIKPNQQPIHTSFSNAPYGLTHALSCSLATSLFPQNTQTQNVCENSFFHPNKANCFVAVHALDTELANELGLNVMKPQTELSIPFGDSLKMLDNWIGSAEIPARVFRTPERDVVEAYSNHPRSHRTVDNLIDSFVRSFAHNNPLVVSVSGKKADAFTLSSKEDISVPLFLQDRGFGSKQSGLYASEKELLNSLGDETLDEAFRARFNGNIIRNENGLRLKEADDRFLDLDFRKPIDYNFIAELAYSLMLPNKLQSSALKRVQDDTPDLFSFVFTGLEGILDTYGRDSNEVKVAASFLDTVLDIVLKRLETMYDGRLGSHLAGFASPTASYPDLSAKLSDLLPESEVSFPSVTLPGKDTTEIKEHCDALEQDLGSVAEVDCHGAVPHFSAMNFFQVLEETNSTSNSTVTNTQIGRYQIQLWLTIALIFITYMFVYVFLFMDNKKDTLLYTRFNQ